VLQTIAIPNPTAPPQNAPEPPVGKARAQYNRNYVVLSPRMTDPAWVTAAAKATFVRGRFTIGGNADDAGVGDLNVRRVYMLNPQDWGGGMKKWYSQNYPGAEYFGIRVSSPEEAEAKLREFA